MSSRLKKTVRGRALAPLWGVALAIALSGITSYYHHHIYVSQPNWRAAHANHVEVVRGEALAPTQYRMAPFFIAQGIYEAAVRLGMPANHHTLLLAYTGMRLAVTALAYYLLLIFLSRWFDPARAVAALLFVVAINPLAEYQYFHQPGDPWAFLLFLLGYLALASRRDAWLVPILLLGVPFRETIALLIPAYVALRWDESPWQRVVWWTFIFAVAAAFPMVGLRSFYGWRESYMVQRLEYYRIPSIFVDNIGDLDGWVVMLLYFNVLWLAVPLGWRRLPKMIRRAFIIVPLFFIAHFIWGRLVEGRLYMPLIPLFLPAGLLLLGPLWRGEGE